MKVTAKQIGYLLKISMVDAAKKIYLLDRDISQAQTDLKIVSNPSVESEDFDKKYGTNITMAATDIRDNILKRPGSRLRILSQMVDDALSKPRPKKKISLPVALKELMSADDIKIVQEYWSKIKVTRRNCWDNSVDYFPELKA